MQVGRAHSKRQQQAAVRSTRRPRRACASLGILTRSSVLPTRHSNLIDPSTLAAVSSPLIALYEVEVALTGADAGLPALVLKDAVTQPADSGKSKAAAAAAVDPKAILVVHPTQAASAAKPASAAASSSSASAARQLHFRIYQRLAVEAREDSYLDDSDDEDAAGSRPPRFQLLGSAAVSWSDLARSAKEGGALNVQLTHPLSASANSALKAQGSSMTLSVRVATAAEASQERAFERLLELAHEDAYEGLAQRVPAEESSHRAALPLALSARNLPLPLSEDDEAPEESVYLASLFERDTRSGSMHLAGLTPWTRPGLLPGSGAAREIDPEIRFPSVINVDYFPGDAQVWSVSLYRFSAAEISAAVAAAAEAADGEPSRIPAALVAGLNDAQRIGSSSEFLLDYLGLESGFLWSARAAAEAGRPPNTAAAAAAFKPPAVVPAAIGRVYTPSPSNPSLLRMELALGHDTDPALDERLRAGQACVTLQVDLAACTELRRHPSLIPAAVSASSSRSATDTEIDRRNREQLLMLEQTLSAGGEAPLFELPPDAFPDAEDVDVSGVDECECTGFALRTGEKRGAVC